MVNAFNEGPVGKLSKCSHVILACSFLKRTMNTAVDTVTSAFPQNESSAALNGQ